MGLVMGLGVTQHMANPWITEQFSYKDMDRMLTYGSIFYGIDEDKGSACSLRKVCFSALAASMLVFLSLDF